MKEKTNSASQTARECDIFISYRRDGGDMAAMYFYQALKERGDNVFYDHEVLRAGKFNEALLSSIESCKDFVLILSPHALDRCNEPNDWVRLEIAQALRTKKNIIPIMMKGFEFPKVLPEEIDDVRYQNGLTCTTEYFSESIDRLCERYLKSLPVKQKKKKSPMLAIVAALAVLAIGIGAWAALRPKPKQPGVAEAVTGKASEAEPTAETAIESVEEATVEPTEEAAFESAEEATVKPTEAPAPLLRDTDFPVMAGSVEGEPAEDQENTPVLGNAEYTRAQIRSIRFEPSLDGAQEDAWNISETGDGSVLAWVTPNGTQYDLTVAGDGGVRIVDSASTSRLFSNYVNVESIDFNGCVDLSARTDFSTMFENCHALKSIDFTGVCTEKAQNMGGMFMYCESLDALDLSGFDTSGVENMNCMFLHCDRLGTLDISGFDTSRVTDMNQMFLHCDLLKSLDLGEMNTARVTDMTGMFDSCEKLKALDVSSFDTGRVQRMSGMFANCFSLEALDVSGFDTGRVDDMSRMFYNCEQIEMLDVSGFDTSRVTDMSQMFEGCQNLDGLAPSGWNTAGVRQMSGMFRDCESLYMLDLGAWDTANVTEMTGMFSGCAALKELDLSGWDVNNVESMAYMFDGDSSLEAIGRDPATFDHGETTDMYRDCGRLIEEE